MRTFEIYEVALRRHVLPALGSRQVRAITPDELVSWIRRMRAAYAPHTVHNYWGALRHTFASILIDQGHDVVFVSRQLGHANPSITLKVYAQLFDAERHAGRAREQLEAEYGALISRR